MTIFEEMLLPYRLPDGSISRNAEQEVMQLIALAGLHRGGFFQHAAFYGGTCLRIFHQLPRFSEDMDFSLIDKRKDVHLEDFFPAIIEEFHLSGYEVDIVKKDKKFFGRVESAFLKENTEAYDIKFKTKKTTKVKIELDVDPPLAFQTEMLSLVRPYVFMTQCYTLPCLYAGKMNALVYRKWQHRIKGRDWYDFEWYVRHQVPLDFHHLQERIREFEGCDITKEQFMTQLRDKLATADIEDVKLDVVNFIDNPHEIDHWTNEYFLTLADHVIFQYS